MGRRHSAIAQKNKIDASAIDATTRELALFVELATRNGSFNVVTSQALATRYLSTAIQANRAMGDAAMQSIEAIAAEMLKSRSLAVPKQRFTGTQEILLALLSQNVLHETHDEKLAFGHQTLLDVLVIRGAIRRGLTLNDFIRELPPVPFVRPSIRSFIAQLAIGDRREFRKQLRTVLLGSSAFHFRRLVAESFAEQAPEDEDWRLIRDLRMQQPVVFQVVYTQGVRVEWHTFWLKHLVPVLKDSRDRDGLTAHVQIASQWKKQDTSGVLAFWSDVLGLDWIDKKQVALQMEYLLSDVSHVHSALIAPVLITLLELPRQEHSAFGRILARCVQVDGVGDAVLWRYITGQVSDEDLQGYQFDNKLKCQSHEFGDSNNRFLLERMRHSTALLDLAVASIERWSQVRTSGLGDGPASYWRGFLELTSFNDAHRQTDHHHMDNMRVLLDAIETAVVHHASTQSKWWKKYRARLCFSTEGALRYFGVLACTETPASNLDVIAQMLCDKALLECTLSYELGTLLHAVFVFLDPTAQDAIEATILATHQESIGDSTSRPWILQAQAQLILAIPCHLRSTAAQAVLNECERVISPLIREPVIRMWGGMVSAPFSFEVFLAANDADLLQLLAHYNGDGGKSFDDQTIGGVAEIGGQLREAASRHPTRFLNMLPKHWGAIANSFCDDILDGVATYLACRHGNLQPNGAWSPIEEPDAAKLAEQVLDELERHPSHWNRNRSSAKALQSCAHVVANTRQAERLTFLSANFTTLREESSVSGPNVNFLTVGINMVKGHVADALMILANRLQKINAGWPVLLAPALSQFSVEENCGVRAVMLRRLPNLQSFQPELGWSLYEQMMLIDADGLWGMAESCLYYAYNQKFAIVTRWIAHIYREGSGRDLETWGRISALAALSKQVDISTLLAELTLRSNVDAWTGAASVWAHPSSMRQHREQCLTGLEAGMTAEASCAAAVAEQFGHIFRDELPLASIPEALIHRFFAVLKNQERPGRNDVFGMHEWLNATSIQNPMAALAITEAYLIFARHAGMHMYDHENSLTQLLTRLFAQAEEQEESDDSAMLQRVVSLQDELLSLGVTAVNDWLKAAERT